MTYYLDFQSISELNQFIQQQIDDNQKFKNIKVIGEISN